jgi:hypothetical protein
MELSYSGKKAYTMSEANGSGKTIQRTYLEDGDEVVFSCQLRLPGNQGNVGFGECRGKILPGRD